MSCSEHVKNLKLLLIISEIICIYLYYKSLRCKKRLMTEGISSLFSM